MRKDLDITKTFIRIEKFESHIRKIICCILIVRSDFYPHQRSAIAPDQIVAGLGV